MRPRLLLGLLLLFALVSIPFLNMSPRTKRTNNPFALKGKPKVWKGQTGVADDGFLTFQSASFGVRAGFINLYQTYIFKGFNTIEKIFDSNRVFPVYGDPGKGELYVKLVSDFSGIPKDKKLTHLEIKEVGRAIERVEGRHQWVSDVDFDNGYEMAIDYLNI